MGLHLADFLGDIIYLAFVSIFVVTPASDGSARHVFLTLQEGVISTLSASGLS